MTMITKDRGSYVQELEFSEERFYNFILEIYEDTVNKDKISIEDVEDIYKSVTSFVKAKKSVEAERLFDYIIRESNGKISAKNPHFTNFSASALRRKMYKQAGRVRGYDYRKGYGDYHSLVVKLTEEGRYDPVILEKYTEKELREIGKLIEKDRDKLFDYSGLQMLETIYLIHQDNNTIVELPQERFLTTAVYLMQDEPKEKRFGYIKDAYSTVLSQHRVGLATPTLKNAGSPHGTLSSCHIVTVDDDLKSIFRSNTQIARFSQNGAGLGKEIA